MAEDRQLVKPHSAELLDVARKVNGQPKHTVRIHRDPTDKFQSADVPVSINGYTWRIKRGATVSVPRSVYLVLVQAGLVDPQREEDEKYVPDNSIVYGREM